MIQEIIAIGRVNLALRQMILRITGLISRYFYELHSLSHFYLLLRIILYGGSDSERLENNGQNVPLFEAAGWSSIDIYSGTHALAIAVFML